MRSFLFGLFICPLVIYADTEVAAPQQEVAKEAAPVLKSVTPFTGKVVKSRVRLRLQPSLEGAIVEELNGKELFVIDGEAGDFYAVKPNKEIKAYIFRTFVLDGKVEGSKVNVRLAPSTDAPVIAQLASGDAVEGKPSLENPKWLEIAPPPQFRLFVAKEYVERVGDALFLSRLQEKAKQAQGLLKTAEETLVLEWQKPFPQISLEPIRANLRAVADDYKDFPELAQRAKSLLEEINQKEIQKKIAYLEDKAKEPKAVVVVQAPSENNAGPIQSGAITDKMALWLPQEHALFLAWEKVHPSHSEIDYYASQRENARTFTGVIEPYNRPLKNRPGDFVLTHPDSSCIEAFLYSTKVNLQDYVGKKVQVTSVERPNNDFAFPAYFVMEVVTP